MSKRTQQDDENEAFLRQAIELMEAGLLPTPDQALIEEKD
jgi:hypothetical protein